MNMKEMITSIVMAIVVVTIFAAMIGTASAGINVGLYKSSVNGYTFNIGDTIEYEMTVTNNDPQYGINVAVTDTLPNGTLVVLDPNLVLGTGPGATSPTYAISYVVELADIQPDGKVHNTLTVTGKNANDEDIDLSIVPKNPIDTSITFNFDYVGTGCMEVKFTGVSTGTVAWHRWNFGDGTQSAVISGAPNAGNAVTHQYTSPGVKTVKLYGESVTGNPGEKQLTVSVTGDPTATAMANGTTGSITLPEGGGMVTLTGTATPYAGTTIIPPTTWSIPGATPNAGTGLGPLVVSVTDTTTATLTVVASNGCSTTASVLIRVAGPQQEVPLLTLPGLLALIGMMCIVGAGRIITRGRRS